MPQRRVIRSLTSISKSSSPSAKSRSSLLPPYAHVSPSPNTSASAGGAFKPPYSHSVPQAGPSSSLTPSHRFKHLPPAVTQSQNQQWYNWAKKQLGTEEGRRDLQARWEECVLALEKVKSSGGQVPQVSFLSLDQHLREESTLRVIRESGVLVVRDVVADEEVTGWAKGLLGELQERQGRASYWHKSLLSARSNPSLLSANYQILSALTGLEEEAFILASPAQEGISSNTSRITDLASPWTVESSDSTPFTPLQSHLAFSRPTESTSHISPSIHAATYASLRPLFRPLRSLISFYHSSAYLDPTNWTLIDTPPTLPISAAPSTSTSTSTITPGTTSEEGIANLPHLQASQVVVPQLEPGDIIYHHSSIPITSSMGQVFLPVSPLPRTVQNGKYVEKQREAYEAGIPPPGVMEGEMVELESMGRREEIESSGGRRAMGYDH